MGTSFLAVVESAIASRVRRLIVILGFDWGNASSQFAIEENNWLRAGAVQDY